MHDEMFLDKKILLSKNAILYIYFSLLFIHTLHIGEAKFLLFGYILSISVSLFYFFFLHKIKVSILYIFIAVMALFILYFRPDKQYVLSQFKYWVYLIPLLTIPFMANSSEFNRILCKACSLSIILSTFLFFIGVGVDAGYGFPRMHGLLSEPSALSFPIAVVLLNGIAFKEKRYLFLGSIGALLSGSLMVAIVTVSACLMCFFLTRSLSQRVLLTFLGVVLVVGIFNLIEYLASLGTYPSLSRLHQGLIFIESFGSSGHNPRFFSVLEVVSYINDNSLFFGEGINGASIYTDDTGNLRDLNLWLEMLLSFGVFGTTIFILYLLGYVFFNKHVFSKGEAIILSSITTYCFLNSAQGIVFQSLFFIVLIQVFRGQNKNVTQNFKLVQKI